MSSTETLQTGARLAPMPLVASSRSMEKRKLTPDEFMFGKLIGEGSFSCVFLALEMSTKREFAIKVSFYENPIELRIPVSLKIATTAYALLYYNFTKKYRMLARR